MSNLVAGVKGAHTHANHRLFFATHACDGAGIHSGDCGGEGLSHDAGGREPRDDGDRPFRFFRTLFVGLAMVFLDRRLARAFAVRHRNEMADVGEHHDRRLPSQRDARSRGEDGVPGNVRDQLRNASQNLGLVDGGCAAADPVQANIETTPERAALAIFLESAGWPYDSERIAAALLKEFGSVRALAGGSERRMRRVAGKGLARLLKAHGELLRFGLLEKVALRPVMSDRHALFAYLKQEIGFAPQECLLATFVDARFGLIKSEIMATGDIYGVSADPFTLFQRGRELGAAGIVLAHNHPSMVTTPSHADRMVTARLTRLGSDLELPLVAHFVVAPGGITEIPLI